jgi:DNA-directed RNA polymerase specialized sigma24 family protein
MPQKPDTPRESLDDLLTWLDPNREVAISTYMDLRFALSRIFSWNQCADPQGMTDETFDRVASKLPKLKETFEGDPKLFFYGVANNLIKEYRKKVKSFSPVEFIEPSVHPPQEVEEECPDLREECLSICLGKLTTEKRQLILSYYSKEKQAKSIHRAKMARELGVSLEALRVRMLRIRATLLECIEECLDKMEAKGETD